MKKSIAILLSVCFILPALFVTPASASAETDRIIAQISATYEKARQLKGVYEFELCTEYVKYQLIALGITTSADRDIEGNGWRMFEIVNENDTSTGYHKKKYAGPNCLYDILRDYGSNNIYNILVCWYHGFGCTYENRGPGHAMFIHAIIDGYIYFSESYPVGSIQEGDPRVSSVESFYREYNGYYGQAVGAVLFYRGDAPHVDPPHVEHDWVLVSSVGATCTKDGANTYVCSVCQKEYTETLPATGHDFSTVVTEPSCTKDGSTVEVCSKCGETHVLDTTPALGHDYDIIVTPHTCLKDGDTKLVCSVCGESIQVKFDPAPGHNFVNGVCTRCNLREMSGDVYADGKLNARDVTMLMRMLISTERTLTLATDVNGDGKLNARDVTTLMKRILANASPESE